MIPIKIGIISEGNPCASYFETVLEMEQFNCIGYTGSSEFLSVLLPGISHYIEIEKLIHDADAILLLSPRERQFTPAKLTLKNSKHLFIEEPLIVDLAQAETLLSMQREADVIVQTGSGMRLNPSFKAFQSTSNKPSFIETHNQITSISGITCFDLLLQDIDFVLSLVRSEVRKINANGVCVKGNTADILNARIEFGNGCIASLTANSNAKTSTHTAHVYERGNSLEIDFLMNLTSSNPESAYNIGIPKQSIEQPVIIGGQKKEKVIFRTELEAFYNSITTNNIVLSSLSEGCRALKLAYQIVEKIEERGLEN